LGKLKKKKKTSAFNIIIELSVKNWYPICFPLLSAPHAIVILYFIVYSPTSTTLFPVLSKLTVSVLYFEDLTDNSNILSAYEVKDETSTSSTYVSLVFFSKGVILSGFAPKYPWIFRG
jgi:hypothetical protein